MKNWKDVLYSSVGGVCAPDGSFVTARPPVLPVCNWDVWCHRKSDLLSAAFMHDFALFLESAVSAGYCGASGEAKIDFIIDHVTFRATGDLFDENERFFDRDCSTVEQSICDAFGKLPRRTANRWRETLDRPLSTRAPIKHLQRRRIMSWSWKVFMARIGHSQYCGHDYLTQQ